PLQNHDGIGDTQVPRRIEKQIIKPRWEVSSIRYPIQVFNDFLFGRGPRHCTYVLSRRVMLGAPIRILLLRHAIRPHRSIGVSKRAQELQEYKSSGAAEIYIHHPLTARGIDIGKRS